MDDVSLRRSAVTTDLHVLEDPGLGNAAYLLDLGDGRALAVDASRDLRSAYATADRLGLKVAFAADTHLHADFVTGATELARRDGATLLASAAGNRTYPHTGLRDGDEVDLGGLRLRALATPGHTDEHIAFEIRDDDTTVGIFTGGSLIVGSAARTDLVDQARTEELAHAQYRSLRRLAAYAPDVAVWPTHGGGSFCSAPTGDQRTSTIGTELATNALLNAPDEDAFARTLLASLGTYPAYFNRLGELNRTGPEPTPHSPVHPKTLDPAAVVAAQAAGAEIVDVRPVRDFAAGHIPGSLSIPLRPVFASWLGWLVPFDQQLVIVRNPGQDMSEVWWQSHKIGFDHLVGQVADGLNAWRAAGRPTTTIALVGADAVGDRPVLDIRQSREFTQGHLPHASHVELGSLASPAAAADPAATVAATVPLAEDEQAPVVVMCGHGERAMGAASLLARLGHTNLAVLDGGPDDWASATGHHLAVGAAGRDEQA
jgi:glyoxylase-like metal-dependent hydrolase (beta-lactamase superfamily II)/rhodanese-related sulfurtransferase